MSEVKAKAHNMQLLVDGYSLKGLLPPDYKTVLIVARVVTIKDRHIGHRKTAIRVWAFRCHTLPTTKTYY